jgi:hypothetical protein
MRLGRPLHLRSTVVHGSDDRLARRFCVMLRVGHRHAAVRGRARPSNANRRDSNRDRNKGGENSAWPN